MSDTRKIAQLSAPKQLGRHDPNSSAFCTAKALALLQTAVRMPSGIERTAFERGAAGWSMRAEQLHRNETRFAQDQLTPLGASRTPLKSRVMAVDRYKSALFLISIGAIPLFYVSIWLGLAALIAIYSLVARFANKDLDRQSPEKRKL